MPGLQHRLKRIVEAASLCVVLLAAQPRSNAQTVWVETDPAKAVHHFDPTQAFGATVDRLPLAATDTFFAPDQITQYLKAGLGPVSYRQNTELFVQAWHWNPTGGWSEPGGQGYFTGSSAPSSQPIRHSFGYSLPHRGVTRNSGSEFDGYSRLDDGDLTTYWKSNPYLTEKFTGEPDDVHPQWVVIKLGEEQAVDSIRIAWAAPFARAYRVQYWGARSDAMGSRSSADWKDFPHGVVVKGAGGIATIRLDEKLRAVRYVRVLMTQSSNTCDTHSRQDSRNCVGYAIRELYLGTMQGGQFHDILHHAPGQDQTFTYSSSIDPWHRATDLYRTQDHMESGDQVGFDLFFTSGMTRGLPAIVPVSILYATPEDAAAEIAYLEHQRYPISYVELGEEPDGQYITPEDYAALYLQWATALHKVDPALKLGGPVFEGAIHDIKAWPDASGETSWLRRFLGYLKQHGRLSDLAFFSFEHYPYYDGTCQGKWSNLYMEPEVLEHITKVWRDDGLPANVPMLITETNAPGGDSAMDIFGALWLAETFPAFLSAGGSGSYYHHGLPYSTPHIACSNSWGTYHLFTIGHDFKIKQRASQFFAAEMLTSEWAQAGDNALFLAHSDIQDGEGHRLVTAYPVHRPDGQWAVLLINKDFDHEHSIHLQFEDAKGESGSFSGAVTRITFGKEQYVWHSALADGYADPDNEPNRTELPPGTKTFVLPAASITILRGHL